MVEYSKDGKEASVGNRQIACTRVTKARLLTMVAAATIGGWLAGETLGQQSAPSSATTSYEGPVDTIVDSTTVIAVEVPVTVVRQGEAVRDLGAEDFEVLVDGEPTPVLGFERVDLQVSSAASEPTAASSVAEPSAAARRHFLFLFDLAMTAPNAARQGLAAAQEMLGASLHPSDRVAIGVYGEATGARLLSGFTENRGQTRLAMQALSMVVGGGGRRTAREVQALIAEAGDQAGEGLRQFAADAPSFLKLQGGGVVSARSLAGEALAGWAPGGGRGGDGVAETLADMEADFQRETRPAQVRSQSFRFLETLGDLAAALEAIRGQRYFVLFSAGLEERVLESRGNSSGASELHRVLGQFSETGWEVHAMAVGGQQGLGGRSMGFLADATNGYAYRNMQPAAALGRMIELTSTAYVLTVQPTNLGPEGSYNPIDVRLRSGRGEVRHRVGIRTPSLESFEPATFDALAVGGAVATWQDGGSIDTRLLAMPFKEPGVGETPGGSGARVPLVIELAGADLRERAAGGPLHLIVDGYLLVPPSGAIPLFVQPLVLDPASHAAAFAAKGGVKLFANIALTAGEHRVRVVVRDPIQKDYSVATLPVSVPRFGAGIPQVLPPLYPEVEDRWLYVGQEGVASTVDAGFPFQFEGSNFLPQVTPSVRAGAALPIFLAAVDLPDDGAGLRVVLETAAGDPMPNDRMQIGGTMERAENGLIRVMASLDTTGLTPGQYRLRLVWSDAETGVVREAWQGFAVVPGLPIFGPVDDTDLG